MSNPQETFQHECSELLTAMEDALLQLEEQPNDPDLINEIFRSMHTIKGTSGVFGFDDVVSFTHIIENLLDEIRANTISITDDLIALLLKTSDHTKTLVDAALNETTISDEEKELEQQLRDDLHGFLGADLGVEEIDSDESSPDEVREITTDASSVVNEYWHISLRFDADVLQQGMDPISFIRYLQKSGSVLKVSTISHTLPIDDSFDAEQCYLGFEIEYDSNCDKQDIEQAFEFVRDMCTLYILPPRASISLYSEMIDSLPEENMRLGEILLASGALTNTELDEVIAEQTELKGKSADSTSPSIGELLVGNKAVHQEVIDCAVDKQSRVKSSKPAANTVLRVDADKLDNLINLVGELVIAGATSNMLASKLGDEKLLESMSSISHLVEEIRDNALDLRMVQIGETFNRFRRVVRDVSKELGKDIKLHISGAETELDKTIVEKIADPLMHLVRNAMDHGIEQAEDREANGKSLQGNLKLNAYHDSGFIVIEVQDDGKGLDRDRILAKAMEKNLVGDGQVLNDHEVYRLIFEPGFSTAEKVTNLSGRGVGMDVVRQNIEALRGTVDVNSKKGEGSTVTIRLPLTLAIIDGFLVKVGQSSFVIPLDMVHECIDLDEGEDPSNGNMQGYLSLRGEVLPFLRLRDFFRESSGNLTRQSIVVVKYGDQQAGFVVDELLGELQTVIKPLGKILQNLKGVSGATILGSGAVAVILDVPNLIHRAVKTSHLENTNDANQHVQTLH